MALELNEFHFRRIQTFGKLFHYHVLVTGTVPAKLGLLHEVVTPFRLG